MSSRITIDARDQIIAKMVSRSQKDAKEKLDLDEKKVGDAIYARLISPKTEECMGLMPQEFFMLDNDLALKWGNQTFDIKISKGRRMPARSYVHFSATKAEYDKYQELLERRNALREQAKALEHQISGVFAAAGTWKKLLAAWPEAKEFIIPYMETPLNNLPAVIPQELNKVLKLPPKKTEKVV